MEVQQGFAEEIVFDELDFLEVVGRGAFGVVSRARWKNKDVAVKLIETEAEKKAFRTELKQLSRVNHPNIVQLYGASTTYPVCLVMEYAEGGSLYNVLHGYGLQISYTTAHAMSWCLQCAKGVEYLHGMKPKALVHRDLKPPNLLLVNGGTILKICDFGTACDIQTHMTNNKGSAAWMAPEVFEGSNYSEKCDVFSWGIIVWEVMTRKKPFDEIGGPAFRIMWAVHNGTRPPLVKSMPKPLELLMTRCWSSRPVERPAMAEVARIMSLLYPFFKGGEQPLVYPQPEDQEEVHNDTPPSTHTHLTTGGATHDTVRSGEGEPVPIVTPTTPRAKPVAVVEEESEKRTSAPASLAASRESLNESFEMKRYSADLSLLDGKDILKEGSMKAASTPVAFVLGHRRTGSHGTVGIVPDPATVASNQIHHVPSAPGQLNAQVPRQSVAGQNLPPPRSISWQPGFINSSSTNMASVAGIIGQGQLPQNLAQLPYVTMDYQLQPLAPSPSSVESMAIYHEHCKLAQHYLHLQAELAVLTQRKNELTEELQKDEKEQNDSVCNVEEFTRLTAENEQLILLRNNLKKQVEQIRQSQQIPYAGGRGQS